MVCAGIERHASKQKENQRNEYPFLNRVLTKSVWLTYVNEDVKGI